MKERRKDEGIGKIGGKERGRKEGMKGEGRKK